jgi:hypothetical protein
LQPTGEISVDAIIDGTLKWSVSTLPSENAARRSLRADVTIYIRRLDHISQMLFGDGDGGLSIELDTEGYAKDGSTRLAKPSSHVAGCPRARKRLVGNE